MSKYFFVFLILLFSGSFYNAQADGSSPAVNMLLLLQEKWQLYDDFSSGTIDTQKWSIDDSNATISIENGEARFDHKVGHPADSSWLGIIDNPETIAGVRTSIRVESCTGDVRGRIGGWVGSLQGNWVWAEIQARQDHGLLGSWVGVNSPAPNYTYIKTLGFSNFYYNWDSPLDIIGNDYVLTMMFSRENITFKTDSNGEGTLTYSEALSPVVDAFLGIGTRSNSGDGPCTIYFDDVYVYRHEEQ